MPGGPSSTLFTHLGGGNAALAIALTTTTTLISVATVPFLLRFAADAPSAASFSIPADAIVREISLFLLLPLFAGMLAARTAPRARARIANTSVAIGMFLLAWLVVGSLASGRIQLSALGWRTPAAIILFCLASQQGSMLPFHLARWPGPDRLAVGIEMTIRDLNLALLVKALLFPAGSGPSAVGDEVLFVVLFYGGVSLLAAAGAAAVFRYRTRLRKSHHQL
jgi:BASS family bile acid:Na+ symporter